ncbi:MAG: NifB/NifX family molybdenum-iron cluster-binding protein, partial [Clostridia bacterium]|nr:NifB/NifX family molybdenum-iron cluster-binding protein [Clostridia bacterium]
MGNQVAGHFGHCENFIFFCTSDDKITAVITVANPGHRPGFLPNFLAD